MKRHIYANLNAGTNFDRFAFGSCKARLFHDASPFFVIRPLVHVLRSVYLDHQPCGKAGEVGDVAADVVPAEDGGVGGDGGGAGGAAAGIG